MGGASRSALCIGRRRLMGPAEFMRESVQAACMRSRPRSLGALERVALSCVADEFLACGLLVP